MDRHRLITVVQALNFLVMIIARFATGLVVTTLESTVLANIFCTLATFFVWWEEPADEDISRLFPIHTSIDKIVQEAGADANGQCRDTPLDFISRDEWSGGLL
ncbi:hypothetical protein LTR53_017717 [Teratosphaeriaceae sp. CCFEE 6253]|nr:hypothetical protein LTR53_017717 [Teratosphaeriaceae sp. CCFEE 6253]